MEKESPKFGSVATWVRISGLSERGTYRAIASGLLDARKHGARTLVNIEQGLDWLRSLPPARIKAEREREKAVA